MAFRIGDFLIAGFFKNSHRLSTHGRLILRGMEMPVMFELTGSPWPDLCGRTLEFEVPGNDRDASAEDKRIMDGFRPQQIGVTGDMTAEHIVKTFECSNEEFIHRAKLGKPPPTKWERCLYLEWYSQNGRVVIELPMSKVHILNEDEIAARERAENEAFEAEMLRMKVESGDLEPGGLEIIEITKDGAVDVTDLYSAPEEEEGYGLIPDDLEAELAKNARRKDREAAGESEDDIKMLEETELMDEMMERGTRTPLMEFLVDLKLPAPDDVLTEEEAERSLKAALAKLALAGVAFHVCEHCSALDAYRMFIEEVCMDEETGAFEPLIGTGWVQNYSAYEYCPKCAEKDGGD